MAKKKKKIWKRVRLYSASEVHDEVVERPLAWDTETDGLNGKLSCITYHRPGDTTILPPDKDALDTFVSVLLSEHYPSVWYAHNAQYDWRYIWDHLIDTGYYIQLFNRTESDIFQITIWHEDPTGDPRIDKEITKTVLRDSSALFSGSLEEFAEYFASEDKKKMCGSIDFKNGERFDINNETHVDYAIRDAVALQSAMCGFRDDFFQSFDCYPAMTVAGSAVKAWQASLGDESYFCLDAPAERFIDHAYYGGMVFLTSTVEQGACSTYDINSSYPAQMLSQPVPDGRIAEVYSYIPDKLGFYRVIVETPKDLIIPILPCRSESGHMQWRSGIFETYTTSVELEFALEHGYILHEIIVGLVFTDKVLPFQKFIDKCKQMRTQYKGTSLEMLAKLMQNALYGKFATKIDRISLFIPRGEQDEERMQEGYCVNGEQGIWAEPIHDPEIKRMPHWAAFITAYARLSLLKTIYSVGVDNVVYGDTDSITVRNNCDHSSIPQHQSEYGYFKKEKSWESFRAIAPKVYAGRLDDDEINIHNSKTGPKDMRGHYIGKVKGIPKSQVDESLLERIFRGEKVTVEYESVPKLVSILKGKANAGTGTIHNSRTLTDIANSSNWQESCGTVRCKAISETECIRRVS